MKIFSIVGWSGSQKTTLITRLIKQFKAQDKKVVAVKHAPHKYYIEPESADTFKFLQAGADEACLTAKNEFLTMRWIEPETDILALLKSKYTGYDILLLEGLHPGNIPIIEVFDADKNDTLKFPLNSLCAVVSEKPVATHGTIPNFHINHIDDIIHFMEVYDE